MKALSDIIVSNNRQSTDHRLKLLERIATNPFKRCILEVPLDYVAAVQLQSEGKGSIIPLDDTHTVFAFERRK